MKKIREIYYKLRKIEYCVYGCKHKRDDHKRESLVIVNPEEDGVVITYGKCLVKGCKCTSFIDTERSLFIHYNVLNRIGGTSRDEMVDIEQKVFRIMEKQLEKGDEE